MPDNRIKVIKGLSPRVRGNPLPNAPASRWTGSIPACAGEPHAGAVAAISARVYPRVCGGTYSKSNTSAPASGLSPRVRGNLRNSVRA